MTDHQQKTPRKPKLKYGTFATTEQDREYLSVKEPYNLFIYQRYEMQPVLDLFDNWPEPEPEPESEINEDIIAASMIPLLERLRERAAIRKKREKYVYYPNLPPVSQDFLSGKIPATRSPTYLNYWGEQYLTGTEFLHPVWHPLRCLNFGQGSVTVKNFELYPEGFEVTWGDADILENGDYEAVVRLRQDEFIRHYRSDYPSEPSTLELAIEEKIWPFGENDAVIINNAVMFLRKKINIIPIRFVLTDLNIFIDRIHDIPWQAWCTIPEPVIDFFDLVEKKS